MRNVKRRDINDGSRIDRQFATDKRQNEDMFQNTMLVIGKHTGCNECHEFIFLVPAMETKSVYDAIEDSLYQRIWEVSKQKK